MLQLLSQQLTDHPANVVRDHPLVVPRCLGADPFVDALTSRGFFINFKGRLNLRPSCRESQLKPDSQVEKLYQNPNEIHNVSD